MKNFAYAVIAFAIVVMPYTYYYLPVLNHTKEMKQEISNLRASLARIDNNRDKIYREIIKETSASLDKEKQKFNFLFPAFSSAKVNIMAPFTTLRNEIPDEWNVIPEGKFRTDGNLVFWPFNFKYVGNSLEAIKALAYMEINEQFMLIDNFKIESKGDLVLLSGKVELVYQEKPLKESNSK